MQKDFQVILNCILIKNSQNAIKLYDFVTFELLKCFKTYNMTCAVVLMMVLACNFESSSELNVQKCCCVTPIR